MKKINKGYELINGEWVDLGLIEKAFTKEELDIKAVDNLRLQQGKIREYLAQTDVKVTKYRDQLELIKMNLLEKCDLSVDEYEDLIITRQNKREEYRLLETQIYDIENPTLSTEEATPYEETN